MFGSIIVVAIIALAACLLPGSTAGTVRLPSYPLAVRSPYLSTWVPGNQVLEDAATAQPEFWSGEPVSWPVLARVNGRTYSLFGVPDTEQIEGLTPATTIGVSFSSSHTFVNVTAGGAKFTLDFFSPVLPQAKEYLRQSLPYSYLTVNATGSESVSGSGKAKVQVLSGIDHSWTAQDGQAALDYSWYHEIGYFSFNNPDEIVYSERGESMATYGSVIFAMSVGQNTYRSCGNASSVYAQFIRSGTVVKPPSCQGTDLAVLVRNLGVIDKYYTGSVTFAVGFDREHAINYLGNPQTSYHHTRWATIPEAAQFFIQDFPAVLEASWGFDKLVRSRSKAVSGLFGEQYADIVEASVRQTFGAMELTVCQHCHSYYCLLYLLTVGLCTGTCR